MSKMHWPSFIRGVGMLLDIGGTMQGPPDPRPPEVIDAEAIAADWLAVGNALRCAMKLPELEVDGHGGYRYKHGR